MYTVQERQEGGSFLPRNTIQNSSLMTMDVLAAVTSATLCIAYLNTAHFGQQRCCGAHQEAVLRTERV
jgi:hypothetical protein